MKVRQNNDPISGEAVKGFYTTFHDKIASKRHNSPYWLRRYTHRQIHAQFLPYLSKGQKVLDAGCGEGNLSLLVAQQGIEVIGTDISAPNLTGARYLANQQNIQLAFFQGDAENLPFPDNSFDVVLSSHVLEHLPDLQKGLKELYRVTQSVALIAMPTCLNPACWSLLGGGGYYKIGKHTIMAMPIGFSRTVSAFFRGEEGPDEGYGGNNKVPHVWRFPWVMRRHIEQVGFHIERFEAGPLIVPYMMQYLSFLRPLQSKLDNLRHYPIIRNLGYGSMAVCRKKV